MRYPNQEYAMPIVQAYAADPVCSLRTRLKSMTPKERQQERTRIAKERHLAGVPTEDIVKELGVDADQVIWLLTK